MHLPLTPASAPTTAGYRERTWQKKHADLLRAATRLFAQQGIVNTSTSEVAAAAKSTERTLFNHFQSKEGLVRAVIAEAIVPHLAERAVSDVRALLGCAPEELEQHIAGLLSARRLAYEENTELTRLLLMELVRDEAVRKDFGAQWYAQIWLPIRDLFAELQAGGKLRHELSADTLATIFYSITVGYLIGRTILAPEAPWRDEQDVQDLARFFLRGAGA
ncbi:MAG TPA: helix-turn-helix domain-containing protein [Noviherbaspirillum sp.]|nr:helix-turn-helix domain-containing protein [Noviherbaspirillum sp.]